MNIFHFMHYSYSNKPYLMPLTNHLTCTDVVASAANASDSWTRWFHCFVTT